MLIDKEGRKIRDDRINKTKDELVAEIIDLKTDNAELERMNGSLNKFISDFDIKFTKGKDEQNSIQ